VALSPNAIGAINTSLIPANQAGGATNGLTTQLGPLDPRTFGEASVSFSALFGQNTCGQFGSAYLKSRSSDSFTAALKDFVPPANVSISNCAALTTNASNGTQATAQTIGGSISDTATLSGISANAGGTITFNAYGPNDANCSGTAAFTSAAVPVSGPGNYSSGAFTPTAVGQYRWTATYSGDASNQSAASPCNAANESSFVVKKVPAISTNASNGTQATAQTIGGAISDTATLSNATSDATGTITFKLYSDSNCQTEVTTNLSPVSVSGNGQYNSGNFTPTATGTYYWIASYSGDAKNEAKSGTCGDANESSIVVKKAPAISTDAVNEVTIDSPISDQATLSGATADAGGTITFHLFSSLSDCQNNTNEINTGLSPASVNGNGQYNSGNFTPTAVGTYYWVASYSGDNKNQPVSGQCGDADESSVVKKALANVETAQKLFPQDSATLSASAGGTPTGSVTFKLYNNADCSGTAVYTQNNVNLVSGTANTNNTSFSVDQASSGNYKWLVEYSGDAKHESATSACGKEAFTATIDNDTTN
jgi:hypothetical protein